MVGLVVLWLNFKESRGYSFVIREPLFRRQPDEL
jgi:hypothetical protein